MKSALSALALASLALLPACGEGAPDTPADPFDLVYCRPAETEAATLSIGDIEMQPGEFEVTVAANEVGGSRLLFRLDEAHAAELAALTQEMVGEFVPLAVDGEVLMRPTVMEPILGGELEVSGIFTRGELEAYAERLSLPCEAYEQ